MSICALTATIVACVGAIATAIQTIIRIFTAPIKLPVDTIATIIETPIRPVAGPVQEICLSFVARGVGAIRLPVETIIDTITLIIQAIINTIAPFVESILNTVAALVEPIFNAVTPLVECFFDTITAISPGDINARQNADKQNNYFLDIHIRSPGSL